ncbi:MAG: tetratricopeptide repeat protein, partial [bacterium]|nr:tetratricopeptide repeat protein [bacterium]
MKQRKTVLDMYWDSLETGVREGYAMLAVPVWFDGRLADRLAEEFDTPLLTIHDKFSRERSFVSKYENRGWIIEQGLREYLLEKAAHIYGDGLEDIHRCLAQYYREFSGQGLSSRKHEATYLYFHHLLQVEPLVAGQAVLGHLDETEDINLQPVLKSLVSIYRMLPGRIEPAPEFKLLELFLAAFAGRGDTKALKHIRSECEEIREAADEENRVLLKQVYRLQISLQHQLGGKKADKIIKKLNKKIEKLSGAVEVPTFDYSKNSHDKTSRKNSFGKYKQVLQSVGKIIALHQRGDDEGAGREREYLAELQKDRKDLLSKSYCNIAAALAGKTGTTDWESEYIELALKTNRFDAVVLNAKGERLAKMGKIEEAIQLFDRSYKVNPNDEVCLNAKGKLLAKMGKFEQAIELFDHAFQVNPNDGVCLNAKAELLAKMGKFKQAIELFDRAHAIAPNNEVPLNAKAELMAKMGKFEEAIQLFDLAHTIAPKNEVCLTAKAELLAKMGKHKQALELFDRAQAIAPNNAVSLNAKAKLLAKMGKFKQAIELFDRALRISPDNAIPLTAKGALLAKMGKPTEAIELFDRALEIAPDNVISITAKGELLVKMGKFEQAIQLFDRAHAIAPNNAVCLTAKAELLAKMGKTEEAIELFDRAHAIAPNNEVPPNAKAELMAKMGKFEEAIQLF